MTPIQKPGFSEQTVETPDDFMEAVRARFGFIEWDLAATDRNAKAREYVTKGRDTFKVDWHRLPRVHGGWLWLNPEYGTPEDPCKDPCTKKRCPVRGWHTDRYIPGLCDFMGKCAEEGPLGAPILALTPLTSADWYRQYVEPFAYTLLLSPRLKFKGHATLYPKDLALHVYGYGLTGVKSWRWK